MISDQASQSTAHLEPNVVLASAYGQNKIILQGSKRNGALKRICQMTEETCVQITLEDRHSVLEYEPLDQVISVETGIKISHLNEILANNQQYFPCSGDADRSLLDCINSGDCGYFEHSNGGMRSLVLGLSVALFSGELIKTGGKVVKNVSGYDLTKIFVGSRGTLGLPVLAHLRLFAKPQLSVTMAFFHTDYAVLQNCLNKLLRTGLPLTACEFFVGSSLTRMPQGVVLVLNIAEHKSVIAELIPQIESFIIADGVKNIACEESIFSDIEDLLRKHEWMVETSVSQKMYSHLEEKLRSENIDSHYRPGNGRLRILARSEDEAKNVSVFLKDLASVDQPLLVSSAREKFEYYVEQYPLDDKNLNVIKDRIKNQFDPDRRLNPFARL